MANNTTDALRKALEEIADPIAAMRLRAEQDGGHLNGPMAILLANDVGYLKKIAREALATHQQAQEPQPDEWLRAQAICDLPDVDEAIRGLLEDRTSDNATMVVRAVMRAYTAAPAKNAEQEKDAIADVIAERQRQMAVEGWTPEHDDEHESGDLALAAAAYVLQDFGVPALNSKIPGLERTRLWPWHLDWWKPKDKRRNLVRATALLIAEIERLDRAAIRSKQ